MTFVLKYFFLNSKQTETMRQHIASEGVLKAYKRVERTGESHNFEEFDQCLARIAAVDKTDQFMVCLIAKYETPDDRKTPILLIPIRIGIFSNQGFEIYPSADDTYPRVASSAATTNLLQQSYVEGRYDQVKALMQTGEKLRFDFSFPHTQPANVPEIIPGLDFSMAEWKTIIQLDPEIVYQNVDSQQNNMLMRAIICQQFDLALFILQIVGNNICINQKNLENKTALYYMLTNGAWKNNTDARQVLDFLTGFIHTDIELTDQDVQNLAIQPDVFPTLAVKKIFIRQPLLALKKDRTNNGLLHRLVAFLPDTELCDIFSILLKNIPAGFLDYRDANGDNFLSVAGKKGKLGLIELIMRNDSRWNLVNSTNKQNRGPLEETMRSGSINAFKQILKFQSGIFVMDSIHKSVFLSLVTQSQPGYEPYFVAYIAFLNSMPNKLSELLNDKILVSTPNNLANLSRMMAFLACDTSVSEALRSYLLGFICRQTKMGFSCLSQLLTPLIEYGVNFGGASQRAEFLSAIEFNFTADVGARIACLEAVKDFLKKSVFLQLKEYQIEIDPTTQDDILGSVLKKLEFAKARKDRTIVSDKIKQLFTNLRTINFSNLSVAEKVNSKLQILDSTCQFFLEDCKDNSFAKKPQKWIQEIIQAIRPVGAFNTAVAYDKENNVLSFNFSTSKAFVFEEFCTMLPDENKFTMTLDIRDTQCRINIIGKSKSVSWESMLECLRYHGLLEDKNYEKMVAATSTSNANDNAANEENPDIIRLRQLVQSQQWREVKTLINEKRYLVNVVINVDRKTVLLHEIAAIAPDDAQYELIDFVVAAGANLTAQEINGETPLHVAIMRRRYMAISNLCWKYLQQSSQAVNIWLVENNGNETGFSLALTALKSGHPEAFFSYIRTTCHFPKNFIQLILDLDVKHGYVDKIKNFFRRFMYDCMPEHRSQRKVVTELFKSLCAQEIFNEAAFNLAQELALAWLQCGPYITDANEIKKWFGNEISERQNRLLLAITQHKIFKLILRYNELRICEKDIFEYESYYFTRLFSVATERDHSKAHEVIKTAAIIEALNNMLKGGLSTNSQEVVAKYKKSLQTNCLKILAINRGTADYHLHIKAKLVNSNSSEDFSKLFQDIDIDPQFELKVVEKTFSSDLQHLIFIDCKNLLRRNQVIQRLRLHDLIDGKQEATLLTCNDNNSHRTVEPNPLKQESDNLDFNL